MTDDRTPPEPEPVPEPGRARRRVWRWSRRFLGLLTAIVAAALVSLFTLDLGRAFPQIRTLAEEQGSRYLNRPLHVGRISILLSPGWFALDDVVIEGRRPGDRPFFQADRIFVHVPWWRLLSFAKRELIVELELTRWQMVVERWADGHNVPRLVPQRTGPSGPRRFVTTVNFVYATDGSFIYDDHQVPWSVTAPNLNFDLVRSAALQQYVGSARFSGGAVQIQQYKEMAADFEARFVLEGPRVSLHHIDLVTDGATSHVSGTVDFSNWPAQTYHVNSTVDFPRMREIFFANETWELGGTGKFAGTFELFKAGGYSLAGNFESDEARVNAMTFEDLHGGLVWTPIEFSVTHADASIFGGSTRFAYGLAPLGSPTGAMATFSADYAGIDLTRTRGLIDLPGIELSGRASGYLSMQWPNGRFGQGRRGAGRTFVSAPEGVALAPLELPAVPLPVTPEPEPFDPHRPFGQLALGADVSYEFDAGGWTFFDSRAATPATAMTFGGRMDTRGESEFSFHVTSHDWQESDRLLAAIMTAVAGRTGAIEIGGRGTFDGVMTGSFRSPRISGRFAGEQTRVWDVTWGRAEGDVVIEGGYVDILRSQIGDGPDSSIVATGRFALGFRDDEVEEINAHVTLTKWPMVDLRHAFGLDDWPVDGTLAEVALDLRGKYREMYGEGTLRIDNGVAWGERFDNATGALALEGTGLRVHRIELRKGPGLMRGDAHIGWDGTYAFHADGTGVPVESLDSFTLEQAPLSGRLAFIVDGAGEFESPTYTFRGSVDDLFIGEQGVGRVQGDIRIDRSTLLIERLAASSSLLDVDGRGRIDLSDQTPSELHIRFTESSIDPYLQLFAPSFSPYTRAIVSGTLDVAGRLGDLSTVAAASTINNARLTLFDYELTNEGPIQLRFDRNTFDAVAFHLRGSDTNLELTGGADFGRRAWNLSARGDASLAILQLFFQGLNSSGAATLNATLSGSFEEPQLSGEATVVNGRLRPLASPHSLTAINGRVIFDEDAIRLDGCRTPAGEPTGCLRGRIGSGDVVFGGSIALDGYAIAQYDMTATGRSMRLRYPTGFTSTVDMDLSLIGPAAAPRLTGVIDVLRIRFDEGQSEAGLFGLTGGGDGDLGASGGGSLSPSSADAGIPLGLDIAVTVPRMPFIETQTARIEGLADLHVGGTFDFPAITGTVEILGGEMQFQGNRYFVRRGSIDFINPSELEPVFDIMAETRPRVAGETYNVTVGISGTMDRLSTTLISDPWLPETDIVALLLGGTPSLRDVEQRTLMSPQESQRLMIQTAGAALLASPISSRIGTVVERTLQIDTVQITPILESDVAFEQLNPSARVTLGKRISPRVFLTYSRTLNASQEEIILLEYDQSDRVSWVLSRNEDRTFALDVRIRFAF